LSGKIQSKVYELFLFKVRGRKIYTKRQMALLKHPIPNQMLDVAEV